MTLQAYLRGRNALGSAAAAYLALIIVTLCIGGTEQFLEIVMGFTSWFLSIVLGAGVIGSFVSSSQILWSVLVGFLCGFGGAAGIVLYILSQI